MENMIGDGTVLLKRELSVLEDRRLSRYRFAESFKLSRSETCILAIINLELVVEA